MANFEWYRSFVAIYKEGSITGAAQARFMTQPALSQHLAALETQIGQPLFKRTARQMVPTEQGKELYSHIAQAVDRLEQVSSQRGVKSEYSTIRLGGPVEYIHKRLFHGKDLSPYRVNISIGESRVLLDLLKSGSLDIVISTQNMTISGIQFVKLASERFHLVGKAGLYSPIATNNKKNLKQCLEQQDWISYATELPIIRRLWLATFAERPSFFPRIIIPDLRVIKSLVKQGHGISVLPDYLVQNDLSAGMLTELWMPTQPITNDIWCAYRTADRNDIGMMAFIEQILYGC